jgi:hypothetical protein
VTIPQDDARLGLGTAGRDGSMTRVRVASFSVENLFERAKVFNFWDQSIGDDILEKIDQLQGNLNEANYTELRKKKILQLYGELKDYIEIREDRNKLFKAERLGSRPRGGKRAGRVGWDHRVQARGVLRGRSQEHGPGSSRT